MNLDLDILIVLEVLGYIVNLTQFIKCYEDTYLPLAVYWGCEQLHFPEVHFTQNFPHYFSHLPTIPDIFAIPDISIIFCSVGARVPRGFDQLIKVLRKETGRLPSEAPWGRNNNFIPAPRPGFSSPISGFSSPIFGFGLKAPSNRGPAGRIPCFARVRPKRCGRSSVAECPGKSGQSLSLSLSLGRGKNPFFPNVFLQQQEAGGRATRSNSCN